MPVFGPPSAIVVGEPAETVARTSTPWLIVLLHEHFHQLQNSRPGYFEAVENMGLTRGDTSGMWMLNYPFPYGSPEIAEEFKSLGKLLLASLAAADAQAAARKYARARERFMSRLSADDRKYLGFQIWQEGIAHCTRVRCA